jgi:heme/copper-type cytochrome/quinol oxidase subunit 2
MSYLTRVLAVSALVLAAGSAYADQTPITLTLKDHHFSPAEVAIPADTTVTLLVTNQDSTPAEFESDDFSAEKVLVSGQQEKIEVGPFKAGTYEFHDEYNEDESKSKITVK